MSSSDLLEMIAASPDFTYVAPLPPLENQRNNATSYFFRLQGITHQHVAGTLKVAFFVALAAQHVPLAACPPVPVGQIGNLPYEFRRISIAPCEKPGIVLSVILQPGPIMRNFSAISLVVFAALEGQVCGGESPAVATEGPGIEMLEPAPESTVDTVQPFIRGSFTDRGNGVDPFSLQTASAFHLVILSSSERGFVAFPNTDLAPGCTFSVIVSVADLEGSVTTVTWDFTVAADASGGGIRFGPTLFDGLEVLPGVDAPDHTDTSASNRQ